MLTKAKLFLFWLPNFISLTSLALKSNVNLYAELRFLTILTTSHLRIEDVDVFRFSSTAFVP